MELQRIGLSFLVGVLFLFALYILWVNIQANQHLAAMKRHGMYFDWVKQNRWITVLPILLPVGIIVAGVSFMSFLYIGLAPSSGNAELVPCAITVGLVVLNPFAAIFRAWRIKRVRLPTQQPPDTEHD